MQNINKDALTPLMRQYYDIKIQFPDAILFFQVGDFYELFFDDARNAAAFLGIALTKRGTYNGEPIPLCGVPVHALDHYLSKLVKGGYKVALCNQLELPKPGTIVKRGVTQVLTPGTLTDSKFLDDKSPSYLFSFFPTANSWGLLFGELLTARLFGTIIPARSERTLESELIRFVPDEVILPTVAQSHARFFKSHGYCTSVLSFDETDSHEQRMMDDWVAQQFKKDLHAKLSMQEFQSLRSALYYFYAYIRRNQESALTHFHAMHLYEPDDFLLMDAATQRTIELVKNSQDGGRANTLFSVVDGAQTAMGSRTIKKWLTCPLIDATAIAQRHDALHAIITDIRFLQQLEHLLSQVGDLERLVGRIALGRSPIHDYRVLKGILAIIPEIRNLLSQQNSVHLLSMIAMHIDDFSSLQQLLESALCDEDAGNTIIKSGFNVQLDEMRDLVSHGNQRLLALEASEQKKTGISSLKIRFNQVSGYSFEVTKANLSLVPDYFVRQQTLSGKERYTTTELENLERDLTYARTSIEQIERDVFAKVKQDVYAMVHALRSAAYAVGRLDALFGFAKVAYDNGYVRPQFHDGRDIIIHEGRHPVVERSLGSSFIPNDVSLNDEQSLWIITGPNMGGKSTFLRQNALIAILAQAGSFVPARSAQLPILDRIFTRIGAGDNVAEGKSTFLVEMEETAVICTQATSRSLVILDEVGRGTSTFDGLAIAQAVVEYIAQTVRARCLFATHYHELTLLKEHFAGIESYYAASSKTESGLLFLYAIKKGVASGSFGIEVAKLAEIPAVIVHRAHEILQNLQSSKESAVGCKSVKTDAHYEIHNLAKKTEVYDAILRELEEIDFDEMTPKKAFDLIWKIKNKVTQV